MHTTHLTKSCADFSNMNGRRDIFLDKIFHKTFIKVDEKGTEAAAVTVIGGTRTTSIEPEIETKIFKGDHPFVYLIRDQMTGTILFIGKMLDPET